MGKIKSAWEKALERIEEKSKNVTPEDMLRMECRSEGQKLVGKFIGDPGFSLAAALAEYSEEKRRLVEDVVEDTLVQRLDLPDNEQARQENRRVMEGLREVKSNTSALAAVAEELEYLSNYYLEARKQSHASLREDFGARIDAAMQQRGLKPAPGMQFNPEGHPQFREELAKLMDRVRERFAPALEQLRQKIREID